MSGFDGKNFIGGEWRAAASGRTFEQRNPAFLHDVTGTFADSSAADVDAAIVAARAAFPAWRALSPLARKAYLDRALRAMIARRDEIAAAITRENGKALREARAEVDSAIKEMDYQIAEGVRLCGQTVPVEVGGTLAYSTREALGPVAIVTPWNFPFNVPCRKGTPALMGGNTVVLKPASLTPRTGLLFTELLSQSGLPAGVVNCVTGAGGSVGAALVGDPRIKAVSFTGSTPVGKAIQLAAARNLTPAQLELGGKNPAIVLPDADLELAVSEIVKGAFACSGQWCTSTSRVSSSAVSSSTMTRLVDVHHWPEQANAPFTISFTGSTPVGKAIQLAAARNLTPAQLELGGKNPAIVLPDADLELAVSEIVKGAFACSGQWCTSTSRVIVLEETADELTRRIVAAAQALVVRDGANEDCGMGPVCGAKQKTDILEYIAKGQAEGARLLTGGTPLAGEDYDHGCFIAPTVFDRVTPSMTIAREEIFGPVLAIMTVRSFEEAVEVANGVAYGLSSSIFTNDLKRALTYMERAEVGLAHVNLMTALKEPQLAFGGVKESGAGLPEAGSSGIEFFTHHKVCYVKYR